MDLLKKLQNIKESYIFFLIIILASIVYTYNITFSDLWIDETFTKSLIEFPFSKMLELLAGDFHPPLYFLLLKIFTSIAGFSDFTIRLFSVIGVLCTLIISYTVGQRVFGKNGALVFCLMSISIPMLAANAHNARMYTWAAFSVTGVFLYSYLYIKTNTRRDLVFLGLFTLMAAYIHYYALIAVFWSNLFVFFYLIFEKNKIWLTHLISMITVLILYLPWLFVFLAQINNANDDFYLQSIDILTILSCYLGPFIKMFWFEIPSYVMILLVLSMTIFTIYNNFVKRKTDDRTVLGLSLSIYNLTILSGVIISLILRPMLMARYAGPILTMLIVPPTLFLIRVKKKWVKMSLLSLFLGCGIYTSISASYISMGPYKQSLNQLHRNHPDVKKIVHVAEVTTGPLLEHNEIGNWNHYWLNNDSASYYTNINVFKDLHQISSLDELLSQGEIFSLVDMGINKTDNPLNRENLDLILSKSHVTEVDTIRDAKSKTPIALRFYILQYQGSITTK